MPDEAHRRRVMVDGQIRTANVTKYPVIQAFLHVPRERYVPRSMRSAAYLGDNLPIGPGRVVMDPRTLGKMLDGLDIQPDELVLDIGCNYGYSTALAARLAEMVVAVEEDPAMAHEAATVLGEEGVDNAVVVEGPLAEGDARHAPYDVILIQGGVGDLPAAIPGQLKDGGRIAAVFIEGRLGVCRIGHYLDGRLNWRYAFNTGAPILPGFERKESFAL